MEDTPDDQGVPIAELMKNKKDRRKKKSINDDSQDAYSLKLAERIRRNKFEVVSKKKEEDQHVSKGKVPTVHECIIKARLDNPDISERAHKYLTEEQEAKIRKAELYYFTLNKDRSKQQPPASSTSDLSTSESTTDSDSMSQSRPPSENLNEAQASRRALILSQMSNSIKEIEQKNLEHQERVKEVERMKRKKIEARRQRAGLPEPESISLPTISSRNSLTGSDSSSMAEASVIIKGKTLNRSVDNLVSIFEQKYAEEVDYYQTLLSSYLSKSNSSNSSRTNSSTSRLSSNVPSPNIPSSTSSLAEMQTISEENEVNDKEKKHSASKNKITKKEDDTHDIKTSVSFVNESAVAAEIQNGDDEVNAVNVREEKHSTSKSKIEKKTDIKTSVSIENEIIVPAEGCQNLASKTDSDEKATDLEKKKKKKRKEKTTIAD